MIIELSKGEIDCIIKALGTVIDEHEGCEDLQAEHNLNDKLSNINRKLDKNDTNLLVQKLLISDWSKMDYELFTQFVKKTSECLKEIIDAANGEISKSQGKGINKCDSCINLYKINNIRCCKLKPLIKMFDGMASLRYLDSKINGCDKHEELK